LKDALVSELKLLFDEITNRQIEAFQKTSEALGREIVEAHHSNAKLLGDQIASEIKGPLEILAAANEKISQDQSHAVESLLADVLSGFTGQIEKLFGGQINGITQLQQKTVEALEVAVRHINDVSDNLQTAGSRASEDMARMLADSLSAAEQRQREAAEGFAGLMEEIRGHSSSMQTDAQETVSQMLKEMADGIAQSLASLNEQAQARTVAVDQAQGAFEQRTRQTVGEMAGEIDRLQGEVVTVVGAVRSMIDQLDAVSKNLAEKLNASASTLLRGAESFERSGQGVTKGFDQIAGVSANLGSAATSVSSATNALAAVVADHKAARDAVATMVGALKDTVANAAKDNSITGDVLKRIEAATAKLIEAQQEAEDYLGQVVEVLHESHSQFAEGMRVTVGQANREFHKELTTATGLLKEAIEELDLALPGAATSAVRG